MTTIDLFQTFGAGLAIILSFLKIYEFYINRVILSIDVELGKITTCPECDREGADTTLIIKAIIKTRGRQPTTISSMVFESDNPRFTDIVLRDIVTGAAVFNNS